MRIGLLASMMLLVASFANAAVYETVYDDSNVQNSKSTVTFSMDNQDFTNDGSDDWIGYNFVILSGGTYIPGTAQSDKFTTINEVYVTNPDTQVDELVILEFSGATIAENETVTFSYDIAVNLSNGIFGV